MGKTLETTMRQRARKIIEDALKVDGGDVPNYEHLITKTVNCDKIIGILNKKNSTRFCYNICPFPFKYGRDGCCSCIYFWEGITSPRLCGCDLIKGGTITIDQAIDGLRIFKSEMEKHLERKKNDTKRTA